MKNQKGQGLVEYVIVLVVVTIMVVCCLGTIALILVGGSVGGTVWITQNWEAIKGGDPLAIAITVAIVILILFTLGMVFRPRHQ